MMANQGGLRDYRKGNWTIQETMVLIEAKKMDDERRMKRSGDTEGRGRPAELRWKWVEDYCWRNGCLRSQNQCNDKWDNLMRDYKKVRDYERRLGEKGEGEQEQESYWKIEKSIRKERNLPSNMLPQIYEALVEVVERKGAVRVLGSTSDSNPNIGYVVERTMISNVQPSILPQFQNPIRSSSPLTIIPFPPQPPPPAAPAPAPAPPLPVPQSQPLPSVDSDTSEYSDSPVKRRRRGEGTSTGTAGGSTSNEVGSAISRSASIIAEAIQACEEREERRHRDLLSLQERRLRIEESKTEISRQGTSGLVDAINKLANSIFSLAAHKAHPADPK